MDDPGTHAVWLYAPQAADAVEIAAAARKGRSEQRTQQDAQHGKQEIGPASEQQLPLPLPRHRRHQWILENDESPCFYGRMLATAPFLSLFNHSVTYDARSTWPLWPTQHGPNKGNPTSGAAAGLDHYFTARAAVPLTEKNRLRRERGASHSSAAAEGDKSDAFHTRFRPKLSTSGGGDAGRPLAPVVFVQSNCNSETGRDDFVRELMKHIDVDSYGSCLHNRDFPPGKVCVVVMEACAGGLLLCAAAAVAAAATADAIANASSAECSCCCDTFAHNRDRHQPTRIYRPANLPTCRRHGV